jgi:hypothetical protein
MTPHRRRRSTGRSDTNRRSRPHTGSAVRLIARSRRSRSPGNAETRPNLIRAPSRIKPTPFLLVSSRSTGPRGAAQSFAATRASRYRWRSRCFSRRAGTTRRAAASLRCWRRAGLCARRLDAAAGVSSEQQSREAPQGRVTRRLSLNQQAVGRGAFGFPASTLSCRPTDRGRGAHSGLPGPAKLIDRSQVLVGVVLACVHKALENCVQQWHRGSGALLNLAHEL